MRLNKEKKLGLPLPDPYLRAAKNRVDGLPLGGHRTKKTIRAQEKEFVEELAEELSQQLAEEMLG